MPALVFQVFPQMGGMAMFEVPVAGDLLGDRHILVVNVALPS